MSGKLTFFFFFVCLVRICLSLLVNYLFIFFCLFFFWVVYFSWLTYRNSLYIMDINSLLHMLQMFLPPLAILFLLFTIHKFKFFMWSTFFFFLLMNASLFFFFFFRSFWCGPCLKSSLNLLQYCFCFMFWFFWPLGMWDLSSPTRDQTQALRIEKWGLNHWTTREVPMDAGFMSYLEIFHIEVTEILPYIFF